MSSIRNQAKEIVTTHRAILFVKDTRQFPQCGFSSYVVQVLDTADYVDYVTISVLENDAVRQDIKEYSNRLTIPQLYVNGGFTSGSDILMEMHGIDELQELLEA